MSKKQTKKPVKATKKAPKKIATQTEMDHTTLLPLRPIPPQATTNQIYSLLTHREGVLSSQMLKGEQRILNLINYHVKRINKRLDKLTECSVKRLPEENPGPAKTFNTIYLKRGNLNYKERAIMSSILGKLTNSNIKIKPAETFKELVALHDLLCVEGSNRIVQQSVARQILVGGKPIHLTFTDMADLDRCAKISGEDSSAYRGLCLEIVDRSKQWTSKGR